MASERFARTNPGVGIRAAPQICVLDGDPDLGRRLSAPEFSSARRHSLAPMRTLAKGVWRPETEWFDENGFGLLLLDGVVHRRTILGGRTAAELLGAGDVLRPWTSGHTDAFVAAEIEWKVWATAPVAILGAVFTSRMTAWPSVLSELADRALQPSRSMALRMAISKILGVELRIQLLLWHLADRWGRVEPRGVALPFKPGQDTIGELVGTSRPRVNTALGALERRGELERRTHGWLLCGARPRQLLVDPSGGRAPASVR